jgi:hypothetical protein
MWVKIGFESINLFICGVYLLHSASDEFNQRHINSVDKIAAYATLTGLIFVCGDFNLTAVGWTTRDNALCPTNINSVRESIIVDGLSECDLVQ